MSTIEIQGEGLFGAPLDSLALQVKVKQIEHEVWVLSQLVNKQNKSIRKLTAHNEKMQELHTASEATFDEITDQIKHMREGAKYQGDKKDAKSLKGVRRWLRQRRNAIAYLKTHNLENVLLV